MNPEDGKMTRSAPEGIPFARFYGEEYIAEPRVYLNRNLEDVHRKTVFREESDSDSPN